MYCQNCGAQLPDNVTYCPQCGCPHMPLQAAPPASPYAEADTGNIGWAFLGFFFPIVGLVLFLVWYNEKPRTARMAGKGALVSLAVSIIGALLWFGFFMSLFFAGLGNM